MSVAIGTVPREATLLLEILFEGYKPLQNAISGQATPCYDLLQTKLKNVWWPTDVFYKPILASLNMHNSVYLKMHQ